MSIDFNIAQGGFEIRLALANDAKAFRMLLPDVPEACHRIVAVDGTHQRVIGAGAVTHVPRMKPRVGPGAAVHVIEPCRQSGVGRAILQAMMQEGRRRGAQALYSMHRVVSGSPEMQGWQWMGFSVCQTVWEHELPLQELEARLAPLIDRMRRQGKIPASAKIIPLYEADSEAVVQLHLDHMGGDRETLLRRVRGQVPTSFNQRLSRVLMVGNKVVGCLVGRRQSQHVFTVEANIVDPEFRNGWANLWLKLEAARGVRPLGGTHVRFTTFDQYADTRSFTEKIGGVTTSERVLMHRVLL